LKPNGPQAGVEVHLCREVQEMAPCAMSAPFQANSCPEGALFFDPDARDLRLELVPEFILDVKA
jgi:hypothetical protein